MSLYRFNFFPPQKFFLNKVKNFDQYRLLNKYKISKKAYRGLFYFFFPDHSMESLNINERLYWRTRYPVFKLRFKPGYQVLMRIYRQKWLDHHHKYNLRQVRITRAVYLYNISQAYFNNTMLVFKNSRHMYKDPTKNVVNWKYVT